ncbi:hypothetical protein JZ751_005765, partial [Albula glossodonta]
MSFRRAFKLICGFAGGSGVLLLTANTQGYLGENGDVNRFKNWTIFGILQAAQPQSLLENQNHNVESSGTGWDQNWDKRDPAAVGNQKKKKAKKDSDGNVISESENTKPKATRNIFLIRHSQYNLNGNGDKERVLTPLGREQAELTGQRLAMLDVEKVSCDLLREGSPIEPVPTISWKPDSVQEDSNEIIVCHANVIRYFVCRALQFPPEGWLRMCLNNGSITLLTIRPSGRVGLRMLGDS